MRAWLVIPAGWRRTAVIKSLRGSCEYYEGRIVALESALREIDEELSAEDYVVERKDLRRMVRSALAAEEDGDARE